MPQQQNNQQKSKALIITKGVKQKLTKSQDAFNKITQRIEKLQKEIEKKTLQLDLALKIYGSELYPAQLKVLEGRQNMITVLWDVYKTNKLSKTDQRHLKNVLQFHFQEYLSQNENEPDEQLKKIFFELEGMSYDKMVQTEKEELNKQMKSAFDDLDVDMTGIDMEDAAAMATKIAEAQQKLREADEQKAERKKTREDKKKKTNKQLENEKMKKAVDEMKQKNISTIYRQLAKLFHPDLEQDMDRKVEKEILMKELIAAYESKNLHALLTLEVKWIHKETDHLESLTEEKLAIYLKILTEQLVSLEDEKFRIIQQPQYGILAQQFGYAMARNPVEIVKRQVNQVTNLAKSFDNEIKIFTGEMALRNIKEMIKHWKQKEKELNDEDYLNIFFD